MENQFVSYELASKLKELGFNEKCLATYGKSRELLRNPSHDMADLRIDGQPYTWVNSKIHKDSCTAPLYQQAFDWFRATSKLNSEIPYLPNIEKYGIIVNDMAVKPKYLSKNENSLRGKDITSNFIKFDSYKEARQFCLEKLIELHEKLARQ